MRNHCVHRKQLPTKNLAEAAGEDHANGREIHRNERGALRTPIDIWEAFRRPFSTQGVKTHSNSHSTADTSVGERDRITALYEDEEIALLHHKGLMDALTSEGNALIPLTVLNESFCSAVTVRLRTTNIIDTIAAESSLALQDSTIQISANNIAVCRSTPFNLQFQCFSSIEMLFT